jgi:hypothetical protein
VGAKPALEGGFFMKPRDRFLGALACLLIASGASVFAAQPKAEGTPVPMRPKPDFSTMNFLIGTWTCSNVSSRRPGPFTTVEAYSMDPSGYWMIRADTVRKASWILREVHGQTRYTYDAYAKQWVRITTGDQGAYSVATAGMPVGAKKSYSYVIQSKAPDIASYEPEVYVKDSDTKKTMTTSFTETSGRVVNVKQVCTKS